MTTSAPAKDAFKTALSQSMTGVTVSTVDLSKVNCPARRLNDGVRRLADPSVKADYTYTSTTNVAKPSVSAFQDKLNPKLT
eukprot:CAMPEP_0172902182 /NCGR_PEP_ID=MMETSP1075-20121228/167882_1 /TAXON_ID=2916 /ORGANISM="Ceratium fusus, Strain PA161109" /LENGTH=80 /DNA_ID=CAMNT_0013758721 /DNA_START=13 /DNA_END=251 /DNA_ORIENTATION=+